MFERTELQTRHVFTIAVRVATPVIVGNDRKAGRRQLIPILDGMFAGENPVTGAPLNGTILPGGVDSQVIFPDGTCRLSARYGVQLDDGSSFYVENNGIRTVEPQYAETVFSGGFVDPSLYYFRTTPTFEAHDERLAWLARSLFVCSAVRTPDRVLLHFHQVL